MEESTLEKETKEFAKLKMFGKVRVKSRVDKNIEKY